MLACLLLKIADAGPLRTNAQIIDFILSFQEQGIVDVDEAMPAGKYSYVPTRGEFRGVRTFGQQLKHIAADNYLLGAGILGEKPPVEVGTGEGGSSVVRSKPEIIGYLLHRLLNSGRGVRGRECCGYRIANCSGVAPNDALD